MSDNNYDPKAAYGLMKKMFYAILAGPVLFLLVALFITENIHSSSFDVSEPVNLALIAFTLISFPLGNFITRRMISAIKPDDDIQKKMSGYQTAFVIRLAFYEGIELFSIVVFMMTGNLMVLLFALISVFGIVTNYPTPTRIRQAVGISETDLI